MRTIEVNLDKDPYKVLYSDLQQGIQTIKPESINGRKIAIISLMIMQQIITHTCSERLYHAMTLR
ncbi:MAG: hypothetical protein CM15mP73_5260 [Hyphomicrobiales bacterium]|nr:MAG: hypothetical protein CM15mP73_5260 [Hyphomicrobiales bacterium]